jgi:hypothetical protein
MVYPTYQGSVEKIRQRRSLPSPERLRVYALERFDAQARRQVAIFPCSRIPHTLRASKWLRPCWTDFFEPDPQPLLGHLILGKFAREHLHCSTLSSMDSMCYSPLRYENHFNEKDIFQPSEI